MLDRAPVRSYNFDLSDEAIHMFAPAILLSEQDSEFILTQGKYAYQVKGGKGGHLCYKKGDGHNWVLIANWCFYGLYIVVRYRKPPWLRPMYRSLFAMMNFVSVRFYPNSIELVGTEGEILRGRRLRLSPPSALRQVLTQKFGYSVQEVEDVKLKLGI